MRNGPWLILGVIALALLVLFVNGDKGETMGLDNDGFAQLVYLGIWGTVLAAVVFGSGLRFSDMARQMALWLLIMMTLVGGYQYRYELQDVANRLTLGLVPGSPLSTVGQDGRLTVMVERDFDGHFAIDTEVNGEPVRMMVDTGASATVLTANDARRAGIDPDTLSYSTPVSTANGVTMSARVTLDDMSVGEIARGRVPAMVAQQGQLDTSLLGMSFLNTLTGFDVRGDRMVLHD